MLFGKKANNDKQDDQLSGLLAEGCSFEGIIIFEGTLRIDGTLFGKVICRPDRQGNLIIGKTGRVELDLLSVDSLMVSGQLFGSGPLIALNKADFHGNSRVEVQKKFALYADNLIIRDKALFQGNSVMIRHETVETKDEIKRLLFNNRQKIVKLPFKSNQLLSEE